MKLNDSVKKIKVGIFFGGSSREREISFVGGRTVYDRLDRSLFEPIPIFVDSLGNFILLNWQYLYKGTIRDFYPPNSLFAKLEGTEQHEYPNFLGEYIESVRNLSEQDIDKLINKVGTPIYPHNFSKIIDFAFLCLHGDKGEDGSIQGILEWYNIPYSGTHILGSAINVDKGVQKELIKQCGVYDDLPEKFTKSYRLSFIEWQNLLHTNDKKALYDNITAEIGSPFVVKSCRQGSSIGVKVVRCFNDFENSLNACFFILKISSNFWNKLTLETKNNFISTKIIHVRYGIGMPLVVQTNTNELPIKEIYTASELLKYLNEYFKNDESVLLVSQNYEREILFEPFIEGREFSCIVLEDSNGNPCVLPPTELTQKSSNTTGNDPNFDYRKKYLPGIASKITPMDINFHQFLKIEEKCKAMFKKLHCKIYARIDGFLNKEGYVILNDPNTTSGMNPASFLFNQGAEIGLDPTSLLTYIIWASMKSANLLFNPILDKINNVYGGVEKKVQPQKIGVLMGGVSSERHISMESGRNVYDKLAASAEYEPIPIFFTTAENGDHKLFIIPINIMLKENADDIRQYVMNGRRNKNIQQILDHVRKNFNVAKDYSVIEVTYDTLKKYVDFIFIALHGRPGEDGQMQAILEEYDIPYNGSGVKSCETTIDKYKNNQFLKAHNIMVAPQFLVKKIDWIQNPNQIIVNIEDRINYPMIGKPNDDGCSTDIKKIQEASELKDYINYLFESSCKHEVLIEEYVSQNISGKYGKIIEITGGLLTQNEDLEAFIIEDTLPQKKLKYTIFEPSQVVKSSDVLSLEEKFLAGEGQNITPITYYEDAELNKKVSYRVKEELLRVAQILNLEGYARIDAFVKLPNITNGINIREQINHVLSNLEVSIIEVNTLPAMTPATCIFHQAAIAGYKPLDFIKAIIEYGMKKRLHSKVI